MSMEEWLCPACETVNNNNYPKSYSLTQIDQLRISATCRRCCHKKNEINWDVCIEMNGKIDAIFPRHYLHNDIAYFLVANAIPRYSLGMSMDKAVSYIIHRLNNRNKNVWRAWRYRKCYRKAVNRVLEKIDIRLNIMLPRYIILEYLF